MSQFSSYDVLYLPPHIAPHTYRRATSCIHYHISIMKEDMLSCVATLLLEWCDLLTLGITPFVKYNSHTLLSQLHYSAASESLEDDEIANQDIHPENLFDRSSKVSFVRTPGAPWIFVTEQ